MNSINYGRIGGCVGYVSDFTGTYIGTLRDSSNGAVNSSNVVLIVAKHSNRSVSVELSPPQGLIFTGFMAVPGYLPIGYYLSIVGDSTIDGAGAVLGNQYDGTYNSASKQLTLYAKAHTGINNAYQVFTGVKQ